MTIYWLEGCNDISRWLVDENTRLEWSLYEAYTGDFMGAPASLRTRSYVTYPYNHRLRLKLPIPIELQKTDGVYQYYFSFWVKFKSFGYGSPYYPQYEPSIYLIAADGRIIGGIGLWPIGGVDSTKIRRITSLSDAGILQQFGATNIVLNKWYKVDIFISPQSQKVYLDGILEVEDYATRLNEPPKAVMVDNFQASWGGSNYQEFYVDTIYLSDYIEPIPKEYYNLIIEQGLGGTTNPEPGTYTYDAGTFVTVNAIATVKNYTFSHWILDASTYEENPISFNMNRDRVIKPFFKTAQTSLGSLLGWILTGLGTLGVAVSAASSKKERKPTATKR